MEVLTLRRDGGTRAVLVFKTGHKHVHAITMDPHVKVVYFRLEEREHTAPILYKGQPYPVKRAVRRFLEAGKTLGITDGARIALKQIKESFQ